MDFTSDSDYASRRAALLTRLASYDDLAVAYSGGVDSSVLLYAAHSVLKERATGVIADSASLPRRELEEARALARRMGVRLVELKTAELARADYVANDGLRCYWCKRTLFEDMTAWARREGFTTLAFGEIMDDAMDERPGKRAAAELGVVAPLSASGFSKGDVRRFAREAGLPVHDKPASACLASRLPRGTVVTRERLQRVEAAEEGLRELGLRVLRVRDHGTLARVELGAEEHARLDACDPDLEERIKDTLSSVGFSRVELATYVPPAQRSAPSKP